MDHATVESRVHQILAGIGRAKEGDISPKAKLNDDLGISSLDMLVVRESLERVFSVAIHDADVPRLEEVSSILELVTQKLQVSAPAVSETVASPSPALPSGGTTLGPDNVLYTDIEIGMPLTGRNNLAETPLMREIGDLRWRHISAVSGVQSKDVVDEDGERLYPTFFYVEIAFPPARPMATFGENDRFTVASTLRRFGLSMLDGEHFLFPQHWPKDKKIPPTRREEALDADVPFLRLSNSFVKQWKGAGWLKKSRPAHPGFQRLHEMPEAPDSYGEVLRIKETPGFFDVPDTFVPLTPKGGVDLDYSIVPDRDLNGAGLLYFANYPMFLDITERQLLAGLKDFAFDDESIDRRTLVHRKTAYFSNAMSHDTLRINIKAWIESPFKANAPDPEMAPIRLILDFEMHRHSDDRLMLRSSAKKVVMGRPLGDTKLLDGLK